MARGRKMSKSRTVEAAAAATMLVVAVLAVTVPGPEMVQWRGQERPCTNRDNVFTGQSKIYTYMSPNKRFGMHSPFQEENLVAHHKVQCQGKPFAGTYRKQEGKRTTGIAKRTP